MTDELDPRHLDERHRSAVEDVDARPAAPDGLPWPDGTPLIVRVVEWASHGLFMADEGRRPPADPADRQLAAEDRADPGPLTFDETLAELLTLVGQPLMIEVCAGEWDTLSLRGTIERVEDVGDRERKLPGFSASHDRLHARLAGRAFPEGLMLDRRTFVGAGHDEVDPDRPLVIDLLGVLRLRLRLRLIDDASRSGS